MPSLATHHIMPCTVLLSDFDFGSVSMDSWYLFEPEEGSVSKAGNNMDYDDRSNSVHGDEDGPCTPSPSSKGPLHEQDAVNPYHVLQIRRDATPSEIRESYRRLALWHHPGRAMNSSDQERERKAQVFAILAACYETLMDNHVRDRFDVLLDNMESEKRALPAGQILIGGQRVAKKVKSPERGPRYACGGFFDNLNTPNKKSCLSPNHDDSLFHDGDSVLPALANSSDSSTNDEDEIHYTEEATRRLFGGPLSRMHKARHFEPFTEPMLVFNSVFESDIFHSPKETNEEPTIEPRLPPRSPTRSAAWTGSSTTRRDGTIVSTTSRVLFDRKMTRTEVISIDSKTKKRHVHVTVTSEELEPPQEARRRKSARVGPCALASCGGAQEAEEEVRSEGGAPLVYLEQRGSSSEIDEDYWSQVHDVVLCCGALFPE